MKKPYNKSGKCGDTIWQKARHGQISYKYYVPADPRTPAQVEIRVDFGAIARRWRRLIEEQRRVWVTFARNVWSKYRLGRGRLSGFQVFMKVNQVLAYWGKPQVDLPPPRPDWPPLAVSGFSITNTGGAIKLLVKCSGDPGDRTILRASAPLSPSRRSCTKFKIIDLCPVPVRGRADITAPYIARFVAPPVGARIFLEVNQMIDGWEDKPVRFTAIVPPPSD